MRRAIAIVDYGAGNLTSVRKSFAAAGGTVFVPAVPADLEDVLAVVVPGVGHFGSTVALDGAWRAAIGGAIRRGMPLLGICLGLQWLFEASSEAPGVDGLGVLEGRCERLTGGVKVPHVGWNTLDVRRASRLLTGVPNGSHAYFTHAYAAPVTSECVAVATHGVTFAAAIERGSVFGVQFHPEKSGPAGLRILANFVALANERLLPPGTGTGFDRAGKAPERQAGAG